MQLSDTQMLIKAALTTNVLVILVSHHIVCVGVLVWLMSTFASSSAVCGTINSTEESTKPKKRRHKHRRTHKPVQKNLTALQEITTKHLSSLSNTHIWCVLHSVTDILLFLNSLVFIFLTVTGYFSYSVLPL